VHRIRARRAAKVYGIQSMYPFTPCSFCFYKFHHASQVIDVAISYSVVLRLFRNGTPASLVMEGSILQLSYSQIDISINSCRKEFK